MKLQSKRIYKLMVFFLAVIIISGSLLYLFEKPFNSDEWKTNPLERYKMVDDLIESQILMDKSMDEVVKVLGYPTKRHSNREALFIYRIDDQPSFFNSRKEHLLIIFENEKVDEVTLALE